jgi:hypothetical protein
MKDEYGTANTEYGMKSEYCFRVPSSGFAIAQVFHLPASFILHLSSKQAVNP